MQKYVIQINRLTCVGLAGAPLVHKEQVFEFDPEISQKRRGLYYEVIKSCVM